MRTAIGSRFTIGCAAKELPRTPTGKMLKRELVAQLP